jgi:hypothetical protein
MNKNTDLTSIDLMYLTNHNRQSREANKHSEIVDKKEVSFYRKRIFQLCKDLLRNTDTSIEIKESFDHFCLTAIEHFKMKDKSEIIQNEYKHLDTDIPVSSYKPEDIPDPNEIMFKKIEQPNDKMDRFIIKHITKKEPEIHLPTQKKYNLKDVKYQEKDIQVKSKTSAEVMAKKKKTNKTKLKKKQQQPKPQQQKQQQQQKPQQQQPKVKVKTKHKTINLDL